MAESKVIGIDFGTSTTSIAYSVERGASREINDVKLSGASALLDSAVAMKDGKFVFGDEAREVTSSSLKAQLTAWDRGGSESPFIYDFTDGTVDGSEAITAFLAEVIRKARKSLGDEQFGDKRDTFYICCPASWGPRARNVLFSAAKKAGVHLGSPANMIDEPVAAGWHVLKDLTPSNERILIFDAGGGTVDVALLRRSSLPSNSTDHQLITVVNADARPESGNELDRAFEDHMIGKGLAEKNVRGFGKKAKEELSNKKEISVPFKATREDLFAAYEPILEKQLRLVGQSFQRSLQTELELAAQATAGDPMSMTGSVARSFRFNDIPTAVATMKNAPRAFDRIFLTGGMAQVPALRETISSVFPGVEITVVEEPQLAVSRGLTRIDEALWFNGSRLPISLRAKWGVAGMDRADVARRYPKLESWLLDQESEDLIPMHTDPWRLIRLSAPGLIDSVPGVFVEFPTPEHLPNERHWEFQIEIQYVVSGSTPRPIVSSSFGKSREVKLSHQSCRPAAIKLLAHRKLVVTGANGERFVGDVRWQVNNTPKVEMDALMAPSEPLPWPYLEVTASDVKDVISDHRSSNRKNRDN